MRKAVFWIVLSLGSCALAITPADPDLIPEARKVLEFLHSIHGEKVLAGIAGFSNAGEILEICGRMPAVQGFDASGWNKPKFGESYRRVLQRATDRSKRWWFHHGGIVTMQFHWMKPGNPNGSAWAGGRKGTGPVDVARTVTPGTEEHRAAMEDLKLTADYLGQLARARVPVLWRPLHEIDGGWFWWTDKEKPENTAALWRMAFDYLVKERKLHNLIWLYSAALKSALGKQPPFDQDAAFRRRYYPGDHYVDIAGIDIYPNSYYGWGPPQEDTYENARRVMEKVAPGKMLALCECAAVPNPDLMAAKGPRWLYALPWFAGGGLNPVPWIRKCLGHDLVVTLDELPPLVAVNVAPNVRLVSPRDGASLAGSLRELRAEATDRDGRVAKVEFRLLAPTWQNWHLVNEQKRAEFFASSRLVATAAEPPYVCRWENPTRGFRSVVAIGTDEQGKSQWSNIVRVTVGLEDLAAGKAASASSRAEAASQAFDGDPFTAWNSEKKDPQWLAVDLGVERSVGAAAILWTKAHARAYKLQVSRDGENWTDAYSTEKSRGGFELLRFPAETARHVRLLGTRRGTTWGGYAVYEFRVYGEVPPS